MTIKKAKSLTDKNGDKYTLIPPAPEGDNLGGISASDVAQINDSATQNMLRRSLQTTTKNGVTCTDNQDGTYTLNGTSNVNDLMFSVGTIKLIKDHQYKLVGCPQGGSWDGYTLRIENSGTADLGVNGVVFTPSETRDYEITIYISKINTILNETLFKPMVTKNFNATYNDFKPYNDSFAYGIEVTNLNNEVNTLNNALNELFVIEDIEKSVDLTSGSNTFTHTKSGYKLFAIGYLQTNSMSVYPIGSRIMEIGVDIRIWGSGTAILRYRLIWIKE